MSVNCQKHFYTLSCYRCHHQIQSSTMSHCTDTDLNQHLRTTVLINFLLSYAYFTLTRQEYLYPDAADRQRLMLFHKKARKHRWDVEKYNRIKQVGQIFSSSSPHYHVQSPKAGSVKYQKKTLSFKVHY